MKNGCLIVNLGSPDEPTEGAIRAFLAAMLSDRCVVNLPPALWKPILHGIILRVRPRKLIDRYRTIWTPNGSPLAVITQQQCDMLQQALPDVDVKYAFCASSPTIEEVLTDWDIDTLTVIPLYPQFATSTVTPVVDRVLNFYDALDQRSHSAARERSHREVPAHPHLRFVPSFATEAHMIGWYHQQIEDCLKTGECDHLLLSFHGIPNQRYHMAAHYKAQCSATRDAIAAAYPNLPVSMSFQSKFGPGEWLGPATRQRVTELPQEGVSNLVVATPAFVADCLETLEEVCLDYRDQFLAAGGQSYRVISPINADPAFTRTLVSLYQSVESTSPAPLCKG